ncbi:MAG: hypothetical protein M1377_08480, partial [Deltaproteobacteria bacterium]|nr:hypothetical protein [Deltaproteobacteria bacterium]
MVRARAAAVSLSIFLLITAKAAWAHHPSVGFGAGTAGPVTTIPAMPLPGKQWAIGLRGDYLKFDAFSDAELEQLAAAGKEVHSIDDQRSLFFSSAYGLTDDLTLGFHIPYIVRRGIREGHLDATGTPEVHVHGNSEGIGDLSLVGQYRFLRTENAGADVALL